MLSTFKIYACYEAKIYRKHPPPPKFLKGGEAFLRINYIEGGGVVVKILVQK